MKPEEVRKLALGKWHPSLAPRPSKLGYPIVGEADGCVASCWLRIFSRDACIPFAQKGVCGAMTSAHGCPKLHIWYMPQEAGEVGATHVTREEVRANDPNGSITVTGFYLCRD